MAGKTAKPPPVETPAATTADVVSLQVSLPQMLDLALGTPEVGAVNLNILHNFLHVLLHQINLRSTKVEYRGEDASRIKTMVSSLKSGPTLHLHEYSITSASGKIKHRIQSTDTFTVNVDIVKDGEEKDASAKSPKPAPATDDKKAEKEADSAITSEQEKDTAAKRTTKGTVQQIGPGTEGESQTIIFVEPIVDDVPPTALGFKQLEQSVNELQQKFQALEELATNTELVERIKGKITDPLTDVWQIINITKRLDASEQGIDKLTTMLQDVIKGDASITVSEDTSHNQFNERLGNLEKAIDNLEQIVNNLQLISDTEAEAVQRTVTTAAATTPATAAEEKAKTTETSEETPQTGQQQEKRISLSKLLGGIDLSKMQEEVTALKTEVSRVSKELENMKAAGEMSKTVEATKTTTNVETQETTKTENKAVPKEPAVAKKTEVPVEKVDTPVPEVEQKVESAQPTEKIDNDTIQKINDRIGKLEKDVTNLSEKIDSPPMAGTDEVDLNELAGRVQGIQTDIEKLHQTADHLIDDRENREIHLNALLEQIELLKTIKADKEDLEDALADKADAQILHRKVSYDQFDAACDDLARGLEDAIGKLGKQETIWQEALEEVQKEIEGKVDKMEMSPLKDFVTSRLKSLQDKLKGIAEKERDTEAAGTKKMLSDVQCISCDKNVVMRTEDVNKFRVEPLPCTMSAKPYLTYELDKVRKQQRRLPHSRNMIQFEAAMQEETKKQRSARTEPLAKSPRDHLCNRYCGGSHTVTTPQQRVMRVGHFLSQWGPEIVQLTEGLVKGKDGKMYRSRPMPGKPDVCGPYCERDDEDRPPVAPVQKKVAERKSSNGQKRQNSKRSLTEESKQTIVQEVHLTEVPPLVEDETTSDVVPIDPLAHADQIIHYDEEEAEEA